MFSRVYAAVVVMLLVAMFSGVPAVVPKAHAESRTVTVAAYDLEPFVTTTDSGVKSGFTVDLLGGDVQGIMRAVAEGRSDMAATNISITADREKRFDFSQLILAAGLQIIAPADSAKRSQPGLVDFLRLLFSKSMLVWFLAAMTLTIVPAHLIWFLERRDGKSDVSKSYIPGIFQAFGWGLGMLSNAPVDSPRRWQSRVVSDVWTFVSIIFVAYYTAILTSNLTVEKIESRISSPGDLVGKTVCTVADTTSTTGLSKLGVAFTGAPKIEDCYAGLRSGKFEAVVFDAPVLDYFVAHDGAGIAEVAGPIFKDEDYGVAFPLGSALGKEFDRALLSVQEEGEYDLLKQKWFGAEG